MNLGLKQLLLMGFFWSDEVFIDSHTPYPVHALADASVSAKSVLVGRRESMSVTWTELLFFLTVRRA